MCCDLSLLSLGGYAWRALDVSTVNDPSWRILTTVVFGDRDDTGRPNNSPMTAAFPVYRYVYIPSQICVFTALDCSKLAFNFKWEVAFLTVLWFMVLWTVVFSVVTEYANF